jgi:hypothetical protein
MTKNRLPKKCVIIAHDQLRGAFVDYIQVTEVCKHDSPMRGPPDPQSGVETNSTIVVLIEAVSKHIDNSCIVDPLTCREIESTALSLSCGSIVRRFAAASKHLSSRSFRGSNSFWWDRGFTNDLPKSLTTGKSIASSFEGMCECTEPYTWTILSLRRNVSISHRPNRSMAVSARSKLNSREVS